jgi:hypothetical protein
MTSSVSGSNPRIPEGPDTSTDINIPPQRAAAPAGPSSQDCAPETPNAGLPPAPLGDPLLKSFFQTQMADTLTKPAHDLLEKSQNNLRYADADGGSGSGDEVGSGGSSSTVTATPVQGPPPTALASPDAHLKTPSKKELEQLTKDLRNAVGHAETLRKKADDLQEKAVNARNKANSPDAQYPQDLNAANAAEKAAAAAKEAADKADGDVDKVIKKLVDDFGIGQEGQTSLHYSSLGPSALHPDDVADTIGTDTSIYKAAVTSPGDTASNVLHESNHARRNKEFENVNWDKAPKGTYDALKALGEVEGYSLELKNAKKLGSSEGQIKTAQDEKQQYLAKLRKLDPKAAELAANGQFDEAYKKMKADLSKN